MGLVCRPEGNLQAYLAVNSGPKGIWIQPIVPPDSDCVSEQLAGLPMPWQVAHTAHLCLRAILSGLLESVLEDLGGTGRAAPGSHGQAAGQAPEGRGKDFCHDRSWSNQLHRWRGW